MDPRLKRILKNKDQDFVFTQAVVRTWGSGAPKCDLKTLHAANRRFSDLFGLKDRVQDCRDCGLNARGIFMLYSDIFRIACNRQRISESYCTWINDRAERNDYAFSGNPAEQLRRFRNATAAPGPNLFIMSVAYGERAGHVFCIEKTLSGRFFLFQSSLGFYTLNEYLTGPEFAAMPMDAARFAEFLDGMEQLISSKRLGVREHTFFRRTFAYDPTYTRGKAWKVDLIWTSVL